METLYYPQHTRKIWFSRLVPSYDCNVNDDDGINSSEMGCNSLLCSHCVFNGMNIEKIKQGLQFIVNRHNEEEV